MASLQGGPVDPPKPPKEAKDRWCKGYSAYQIEVQAATVRHNARMALTPGFSAYVRLEPDFDRAADVRRRDVYAKTVKGICPEWVDRVDGEPDPAIVESLPALIEAAIKRNGYDPRTIGGAA